MLFQSMTNSDTPALSQAVCDLTLKLQTKTLQTIVFARQKTHNQRSIQLCSHYIKNTCLGVHDQHDTTIESMVEAS